MRSLLECVLEFQQAKRAIGHFNVSDSNQLEAVAQAAKECKLPIIVGLSEGEREFFPIRHARSLISDYIREGVQLYLNADHTYSIEKVKAAIDEGVDSVVVDGAKLSFEENVALTRASVEYARAIAASTEREIVVEGELGYIGQSSKVLDALPEGAQVTEELMTTFDEAKRFIEATGAHMLAPAVGNVHGLVRGGDPKLSIKRIGELNQLGVPLVLHGGSGNTDEEFRAATEAGICLIHINTELRLAYHSSLEASLRENETTPYKFLAPAVHEMKEFIAKKVRLFAGQ